jgi:hypothetical protein
MTSDLPFLSYLGAFRFMTDTGDMINKSVKQVTISKQYGAHLKSNFSGQALCSSFLTCSNGSLLLLVQNK